MILAGGFTGKTLENSLDTGGFVIEGAQKFDGLAVSLFAGLTKENDGFIGSSVNGGFAEQSTSANTFVGGSVKKKLGKNFALNATASFGSTGFAKHGLGLINEIENIRSSAFEIEVVKKLDVEGASLFDVALTQPLRVEAGQANVKIPMLYQNDGKLNFTEKKFSLSPSGRQLDLSFTINEKLYGKMGLALSYIATKDAGHIKTNKIEHSAALVLSTSF